MDAFDVFACEGTLVDWVPAIETVVYELARHNGEGPMDRGVALGQRLLELADDGVELAFERLAHERGWRNEEPGSESLARIAALTRPLPGALEAVAAVVSSGRPALVVSSADPRLLALVLEPFGDAFKAILHPADIAPGTPVIRARDLGGPFGFPPAPIAA